MRQLNGIPEELARENQEFTQETLDAVLAEPPSTDQDARQSFHERAGRLRLKLGLLSYALEDEEPAIRNLLQRAAQDLLLALSLRKEPDAQEHRNPWEAEQFINTILCFSEDPAAVASLAGLREEQYRSPVSAAHAGVSRYLGILLASLRDGTIDRGALAVVAQACEEPRAPKDDRLHLLPAALGLKAVAEEDEDGWNYQLARLLSAHSQEARRGDLKLLPAGLMSLRALMLARLGMNRGLECRAESVYLPLELLDTEEAG